MPVLKFLANITANRRFRNLTQEQNEALVDALAAAKIIDGELHEAERAELLEGMKKLQWQGDWELETYIDQAVDRARGLATDEATLVPFFAEIGGRLGEDWLREETYYIASRIALADEEVVEAEREFLQALVKAFAIDPRRQALIVRKIRNEIDF